MRTHKILDHVYTNDKSKIYSSYVENDSPTDHKFITLEKYMKVSSSEENIVISRNLNNVNYDKINDNIVNSDIYIQLLEDDDPGRISSNLIKMIQNEYDNVAPMFKVKVNDKTDKLSEYTKDVIKRKKHCL